MLDMHYGIQSQVMKAQDHGFAPSTFYTVQVNTNARLVYPLGRIYNGKTLATARTGINVHFFFLHLLYPISPADAQPDDSPYINTYRHTSESIFSDKFFPSFVKPFFAPVSTCPPLHCIEYIIHTTT